MTVPRLETIREGDLIPHTKDGTRPVRRLDCQSGRIYIQTGDSSVKYTTFQMLEWAYGVIQSGAWFDSESLKRHFPKETSQGACVFSMTGGVLEFLKHARCVRRGRRNCYMSEAEHNSQF